MEQFLVLIKVKQCSLTLQHPPPASLLHCFILATEVKGYEQGYVWKEAGLVKSSFLIVELHLKSKTENKAVLQQV